MRRVWAVYYIYYKQIRKSEQRPPLHLRAADLVPQPWTPLCHTAIARCKLRQDKRTRARQQARNIEVREQVDYPIYLYVLSFLSKSESIITPVCIEVLLPRVCVGALKWRLPAWWSSTPNPQCTSLGARDSDAGPMLVEERAALLTQLFVRRMRLADSGKEVHGALVRQEIQEPHKLPMQEAGGRRDQGQESLSVLQVVEAVVVHLAFGGVDEHSIGVLSMPKRSVGPMSSQAPWNSWTMATSMIR